MNEIEKKAITLETAKLTTDENAVLIVSKLISDCRNKISVSLNDTWVSGTSGTKSPHITAKTIQITSSVTSAPHQRGTRHRPIRPRDIRATSGRPIMASTAETRM